MKPAEKIKRIIEDAGWSGSELARRAKVTQRTVSYVISGSRNPRVDSAIRIAEALGVDAHWLWSDKPWEARPTPGKSPQTDGPAIIVYSTITVNIPGVASE